jgi:23S rRNA pseudouridine1911/1915/1917 synthase
MLRRFDFFTADEAHSGSQTSESGEESPHSKRVKPMTTRTLTVSPADAGRPIAEWLCARLGVSRAEAAKLLHERKVRLGGALCSSPALKLRGGQRVEVRLDRPQQPSPAVKKKPSGPAPVIRHLDDDLVVVDKPAGLTTMRHADEAAEFGGRARKYLPQTLQDLLPGLIAARTGGKPGQVRAVHRLDKETSGLVVFARNVAAERHLGGQLRAHSVERLYLAVVRGKAVDARIESWIVRDRGDGRRGGGAKEDGQHAVTHVRVVEELGDYTLVECRLETGRTHQVRIHLGDAGTPLCGERVYDRPPHGKPAPDGSGIGRVALHAATLGLEHPTTGRRLSWAAPLQTEMEALLRRLRQAAPTRRAGGD